MTNCILFYVGPLHVGSCLRNGFYISRDCLSYCFIYIGQSSKAGRVKNVNDPTFYDNIKAGIQLHHRIRNHTKGVRQDHE